MVNQTFSILNEPEKAKYLRKKIVKFNLSKRVSIALNMRLNETNDNLATAKFIVALLE